MTNKHYRDLVRKLEAKWQSSPRRVIVGGWLYGIWGYVWMLTFIHLIFVVLAVLIGALSYYLSLMAKTDGSDGAIMLYIGGAISLGIYVFLLSKIVFIREPESNDYVLTREEAPGLFEMVEEVREALGAPEIHRIVIVPEHNAGISSWPRLGLLGYPVNTLVVGMAFMMAHPPDELRDTIGHELGHLIGRHTRLGRWLFRLGQSWGGLNQSLDQTMLDRGPTRFLVRFMRKHLSERYWRGLSARAGFLRRHHEFEADAIGMSLTNKETAVRSLYRAEVLHEAMVRVFWPTVWRRANEDDLPPARVYDLIEEAMRKPLDEAEEELIRKNLASRRTIIWEDHPCLRERVVALGGRTPEIYDFPEPISAEESSFVQLLIPAAREHYLTLFSNMWKADVIQGWREAHERGKFEQTKIAELSQKEEPLTENEAWILTACRMNRSSEPLKVEIAEQFLRDYPEHADANFALGRLYLRNGEDDRAVPLLKRASASSTSCRKDALCALFEYYEKLGRFDELDATEKEIEALNLDLKKAGIERGDIHVDDYFSPHDLSAEFVHRLCVILERTGVIEEAWLAQKRVEFLSDIPCYVLLVRFKRSPLQDTRERDARLIQELARCTNPPLLVGSFSRTSARPRNRLSSVPGSRIYRRDPWTGKR
ncbi:M48 family metalloprotease [bacterium]|nr:M48 family metalloprotease [bacterium]